MYRNFRDVLSILLGLGFLVLAGLATSGIIEYDREKHSPVPPAVLGIALILLGGVPLARRRRSRSAG